ncbi:MULTISPECIES: nitrilase-related carbon-nitrogen hydrolase [Halomonadaceae]|jgi:predicted amidohydrolase|uniref:(R)-stereoselective amidase n=1 Tax=Vreelandella titanicae TaxID=664683 RepID=A0A653X3U5_9GAMM|nr:MULTISPECIES: nitrilase-related carbon-nitrogen hydrolase [Halomonas]QKS25197.1 (R)-stereoselective amidase [Halomonas titanicae]QNU64586.1 amidohydrolase [Halomonas titanicae]CAD5255979.1 Nitrilase/cyanide hydratase and apolipoprotein N-acyltransferase [Halomonas sp. 59]CAD5256550.1 Nitrilase/cyanide hydratase and apolipoprotein N-acyltransferase [Halomonas sp. 113]CAD5263058.1 Nitrilase/cyanide hydratase and apolipoprotein N-acyltransferase [Halomonas sp. I3]|tara:strand:- start:1958 stop:3655 length:1698 start_codon:yes stop_codon:yes gene_type:complete
MKYFAAAVQFEPEMFAKERNIDALKRLVEEAVASGARLIITPEMGLTGYCWHDREEVAPYVEPVPGPSTECFAALAAKLDCYIVIGLPEVEPANGLYYNTAVLIGPDGYLGKHRKSHPYIAEPKWAASGDSGHQVFETSMGRIALLICMDIHFLETARLVALQGADVICHLSNWLAERAPAPYWMSRARENGCYLIESNRWGRERGVQFSGGSCVIEPDGHVQARRDDGDGIVLGEIDTDRVTGPLGSERQPELYHELLHQTYAWNPLDFFRLYGHQPLPKGKVSRIAVAHFAPSNNLDDNLDHCMALIDQAENAELVVLPELALTGLDAGAINPISQHHAIFDTLRRVAEERQQYYVVGFAEQADGNLYNAAALVGSRGVMAVYRKIHLSEADREWATPGERWVSCDLPLGRVGILIGHDADFPEAGRILALRGCDVIACPAALPGPFHCSHPGTRIHQSAPIPTGPDEHHWHHYRVRGGENNCYFAFANVHMPEAGLPGLSGIFGPDTFYFPRQEALLTSATGCVGLTVDTSNLQSSYPNSAVRRKDLVAMRLPHHYPKLLER